MAYQSTDLVIGLDFQRADRALEFAEACSGVPLIFQVGLELFLNGGSELVRELVHRKKRVFLDLKFLDNPSVVARAVKQGAILHVEMISLHLAGGSAMFRAVKQEFEEIPLLRPKLLGALLLEAFDDVRWAELTKALTGHAVDVVDSFRGLLNISFTWGLDGIFCSSTDLHLVSELCPNLYKVVYGIWTKNLPESGQTKLMKPARAKLMGANALLVGSSALNQADPRGDIESILRELWSAQSASLQGVVSGPL